MSEIKQLYTLVKKIFKILTKEQKRKSIGVFFTIVLSSFLEMLTVTSLLPFFYVLIDPDNILSNKYVHLILDILNVEDVEITNLIVIMVFLLISVFVVRSILLLLANYTRIKFQNRIMKDVSLTLLSSYLRRPFVEMININSSEALRDISTNSTSVYYILQSIFNILMNSFSLFCIICVLLSVDLFMTLLILIIVLLCSITLLRSMKNTISKSGELFNDACFLTTKYAYEALNGLKEITVNNRNKSFVSRYEKAVEEKRKVETKFRFFQICPKIIIETFILVIVFCIVCLKVLDGGISSEIIPLFATFAYASVRVISSISSILSDIQTMIYYKAGFNSAYSAINSVKEYFVDNECSHTDGISSVIDFNVIKINDLSWKYSNDGKDILHHLSMTIFRGETVGFIGVSGAGKTTLADIILGILMPKEKNKLLIDEKDIYELRAAWANTVGYVPQTVFLLDDTLKSNVLFGRDVDSFTDNDIWKALEQAQLKDFVKKLPDGLNTIIGERGIKFSGGQRQRIAIARALLESPKLLVLDEATSALDTETEDAVMDAIDALHGKLTIIIIAHRLSTIQKCDKVYEIVSGIAREKK